MSLQDKARAFGWISIGLGLGELLMTGTIQKLLGVENHKGLIRSLGAREIGSGVKLLREKSDEGLATGMWARVAGDAMDLALLGAAATKTKRPIGLGAATAVVAAITALDIYYAFALQPEGKPVKETLKEAGMAMKNRIAQGVLLQFPHE